MKRGGIPAKALAASVLIGAGAGLAGVSIHLLARGALGADAATTTLLTGGVLAGSTAGLFRADGAGSPNRLTGVGAVLFGLALFLFLLPGGLASSIPAAGALLSSLLLAVSSFLATRFVLGTSSEVTWSLRAGAAALGGALGLFLAFMLLPTLGVIMSGAIGFFLAMIGSMIPRDLSEIPITEGAGSRGSTLILLLSGASFGLAAICTGRVLELIIGPTIRSGLIAWTTLFAGTGLGLLLASARGRHRSTWPTVLLLLAAGYLLAGEVALHRSLPWFFIDAVRGHSLLLGDVFLTRLKIAVLVILPWSLLIGILLGRLTSPGVGTESPGETGRIGPAWFGSGLFAAHLACYALLPAAGIHKLFLAAPHLLFIGALIYLFLARPLSTRVRIVIGLIGGASILILFLNPPRWRPGLLNTGPYRYAMLYQDRTEGEFVGEFGIPPSFYREGRNAVISMTGTAESRQIRTNGLIEERDSEQKALYNLLARYPLLFRPAAENGLVLGVRAGQSCGALVATDLKEIKVVEREQARDELMRFFGIQNREFWKDERFQIRYGDPRAVLRADRGSYDLIVGQPVDYWDRKSGHLLTREFFTEIADHLTDEGVYSHWLPMIGLREPEIRLSLRTFRSAFDHVLALRASRHNGLVLIGSAAPLRFPVMSVLEKLRDTDYRDAFIEANINALEEIPVQLRLDQDAIDSYAGEGPLNRDSNLRLEFDSEEDLMSLSGRRTDAIMQARHFDFGPYLDFDGLNETQIDDLYFEIASEFIAPKFQYLPGGLSYAEEAYRRKPDETTAILYHRYLREERGDPLAAAALLETELARLPDNPLLIKELGYDYFDLGRHKESKSLMTEAMKTGRLNQWYYFHRGRARLQTGNTEGALADLLEARQIDRLADKTGRISYWIALAYMKTGDLEEANEYLARVLKKNPRHANAHYFFGENSVALGRIAEESFQKEYVIAFNRTRADSVFRWAESRIFDENHAEEVEIDLARVINTTPNHFGSYIALADFYGHRGNEAKEGEVIARMVQQFQGSKKSIVLIERYAQATGGREKLIRFRKIVRGLLEGGA